MSKLVRANLVIEADRQSLVCVNPLTVAVNARGKRRLCIDLSRCVNKVIKAPKFKIESTIAALQVIEKGDYCFSFDLKSAYLQVKLNNNFLQEELIPLFYYQKELWNCKELRIREFRVLGSDCSVDICYEI